MSVGDEKAGTAGGGQVRRRRRRRWTEAQKRQIVAETHEPGVSVPMVVQRYSLNANQIFRWRRLFREPERVGVAGRFVPVLAKSKTDTGRAWLDDVLDRIAEQPQTRLDELLPMHWKAERQRALAA